MRIIGLHIHAFGKLKDLTLTFDDGVNVIYGPNEAGKSTIHRFIEAMFYGFFKPHTKNRQYEEGYEVSLPWGHSGFGGTLTLEDNGRTVRLERQFTKGKEDLKIYDADTGEEISAAYDYNRITRQAMPGLRHFGHNKITYRNTVSITQMASITDEMMIAEIKDHMSNMAATHQADISVERILGRIEKISDGIGSARKTTSPYCQCLEAVSELKEERLAALQVHGAIADEKAREQQLRQEEAEVEAHLEEARKDLAYLEAVEQQVAAKKVQGLMKERQASEEVMAASEMYSRFTLQVAEDLRDMGRDVASAEQSLTFVTSRQQEALGSLEEQQDMMARIRPVRPLTMPIILLTLLALGGIIGGVLLSGYIYAVSVLSAAAVALMVLNRRQRLVDYEVSKGRCEQTSAEYDRLTQMSASKAEAFCNMEIQYLEALTAWGLEDDGQISDALNSHMAYIEAVSSREQLTRRIAEMLDGRTVESLRLTEPEAVRSVRMDKQSLRAYMEELTARQLAVSKAISGSVARQTTLEQTARPLPEIGEDLEAANQQLKAYDHQLAVTDLMRSTIETIAADFQSDFTPILNRSMSEMVRRVTGGRYRDIKVNGQLELTVYDGDLHRTVPVDKLSAGTIDLFYLGLRLGMSDLMSEDRLLPLILDDPFVQYDEERLRKITGLLCGSDRQVLLFTCSNSAIDAMTLQGYDFRRIEL